MLADDVKSMEMKFEMFHHDHRILEEYVRTLEIRWTTV
jgi:hypothetical protein